MTKYWHIDTAKARDSGPTRIKSVSNMDKAFYLLLQVLMNYLLQGDFQAKIRKNSCSVYYLICDYKSD